MNSYKAFLLGLLVIGIVASLYSAPKSLLVSLVFSKSPTPFTDEWYGTSRLASLLEEEGYNFSVIFSLEDLNKLMEKSPGKRVVVLTIISPESRIEPSEARLILEAMIEGRLSVLVADESQNSNTILEGIGLQISGKPLEGFAGLPYVPAVIEVPGRGSYRLLLSVASDIGLLAGLPVNVSYEALSRSATNELVAVAGEAGGGRFFVISDGTIFLNTAFSENASQVGDYEEFALSVFRYLSSGLDPSEVLVVYDLSHYNDSLKPLREESEAPGDLLGSLLEESRNLGGFSIPIVLHPAIFVFLGLYLAKTLETLFFGLASSYPITVFLASLLIGILLYRRVKGNLGSAIDDNIDTVIPEIDMMAETPLRRRIVSVTKLEKREALELTHNLYLILDSLLSKHMGASIWSLYKDRKEIEHVARRLEVDAVKLEKFIRDLVAINERYEGKRKLTPIVISWDRKFRSMLKFSETILLRMGYTLVGKERLRGVEYGLREL